MNRDITRRALMSCAAAALPLAPICVNASGFALLEQSASRLGSAFSGTAAVADDATTLYFNPAGMTKLNEAQAIVLASGIEITSELKDTGSQPAFGQPLGGAGGDAGDWNFAPGAYFSAPISERFALGVGVNAPFGLKLAYDEDWVGRFQSLKSEIRTMNVNPSFAYRVNDRFSFGAGVSYQRLDAELTNAVNYSAVIAQGVQQLVAAGQLPPAAAPGVIAATAGAEGRARVEGDDDGWGFNVGLIFDLTDTTRLGLAYRSSIEYTVSGAIDFTAPTVAHPVGAGIVAAASASGAPLSSGPVSVALEAPDSAVLSLRQRIGEKFDLLADVAWTGWSSVQELRIVRPTGAVVSVTPERWEDVYRYALGASYALSDTLTLRAGVAYDETPVPAETRTPRLPDANRTWTAVGVRWQQPDGAFTIDVGYAHLFSDGATLYQDAGNPAASGRIVGEQSSDIDILTAQLVYRF